MIFERPLGLVGLLLIPAILLLHSLTPRFQRAPVSSLYLWERFSSSIGQAAERRLPPVTRLLALQLSLAALGALLLAGPGWSTPGSQHLVVVLDGSASMSATHVSASRFEAALETARQKLAALGPGDRATLVFAGDRVQVLASGTDGRHAARSLQAAAAGSSPGNVGAALRLASLAIERQPAGDGRILLITDGATRLDNWPAAVSAPVEVAVVGGEDRNVGIARVSVRPLPRSPGSAEGLISLVNSAHAPATVPLDVLLDGARVDARQVSLGPRQLVDVVMPFAPGGQTLEARVASDDLLPMDNLVRLDLSALQSRPAVVVAADPTVWRRALASIPGLRTVYVSSRAYAPPADRAALVLFDGYLPAELPARDMLIVAPPGDSALFSRASDQGSGAVLTVAGHSALLDGIDSRAMLFTRTMPLHASDWAVTDIDSGHGSLLVHGRWQGRRVIVFGFDPRDSNLSHLASFPLLLANSLAWLGGSPPGQSLHAGNGAETDIASPEGLPLPALAPPATAAQLPAVDLAPALLALFLVISAAEWWLYVRTV